MINLKFLKRIKLIITKLFSTDIIKKLIIDKNKNLSFFYIYWNLIYVLKSINHQSNL